jgi:hypothetical protein
MKRFYFIIFLLLSCAFLCCKKVSNIQNSTPFAKPLSYFPVYPGSYWIYVKGNDTILNRTCDTLSYWDGEYFPELDGVLIKGYTKLEKWGPIIEWVQFLSEKVGDSLTDVSSDPRYNHDNILSIILQKTVDKAGDSIIVKKTIRSNYMGFPYNYLIYDIYKKNVGLVFECGIDTSSKDTTYKKILIKYLINNF